MEVEDLGLDLEGDLVEDLEGDLEETTFAPLRPASEATASRTIRTSTSMVSENRSSQAFPGKRVLKYSLLDTKNVQQI